MNNKKHTIMYIIGLSSIALALAFMISPNNNNSAIAQQNSTITTSGAMTPNRPNSMMSMSSGLQNQNWTGSISLFSPILDAFKSKIHTTLNDATTNAISTVGGGPGSNASALAAFIHPERGFLVYNVFVLDSSNNIHRVIIDPGNGKILSNQPMSMMDMMFMMHHPSMRMGGMMMMGPPHGMDMMQHGMMMRGSSTSMGMMGNSPQDMSMMNRGMGMGMMGPQTGGTWP
jgi:hypothetical protein